MDQPNESTLFQGPNTHIAEAPNRRPTLSDKLGWINIVIFSLVPIILLGVLGFLAFLWVPTKQPAWLSIAITTWLTRLVTISALIIRIGVGLLTGSCASMLASILLETSYVRLRGIASLSIFRSLAPSPWDVMFSLKDMGNRTRQPVLILLVLILVISSALLQFSSTVLLVDFKPGQLPATATVMSYKYDLDWGWNNTDEVTDGENTLKVYERTKNISTQLFRSPWNIRPQVSPIFGEYREPIQSKSGVDDTGYLYRAFLPFQEAELRSNLASFQGPAFVVDSRVSCQKPVLSDLKLDATTPLGSAQYLGSLTGNLTNSTAVDDLWFPHPSDLYVSDQGPDPYTSTNKNNSIPFKCQHMFEWGVSNGSLINATGFPWTFEICQLQTLNTTLWLNNTEDEDTPISFATSGAGSLLSSFFNSPKNGLFPAYSPAYLIIGDNSTMTDLDHSAFAYVDVPIVPGFKPTNYASLAMTVCYTSWSSNNLDVELSTSSHLKEPVIDYGSEGTYVLDSMLAQYGIGGAPDIGAMAMAKPVLNSSVKVPLQQPSIINMLGSIATPNNGLDLSHFVTNILSLMFGFLIGGDPLVAPKPFEGGYTALLQDIASTPIFDSVIAHFFNQAMNATGNSAASSLSALLTLLSSSMYYDQLPAFSRSGTADTVMLTQASYPQAWHGFIAVATLLVIHIVVCFVILGLFLTQTKLTRLGNVWSSIAHVLGPETEDLIKGASLKSDKEMDRLLADQGGNQKYMRLCLVNDDEKGYRAGLREMKNR
ncbi:hypothetical protein F5Y12DRAFT_785467 [Xylaria sp. FL1777]|nr:hypothetical protein F5Y12DRAFT_785467 [Xylaria sp. FL1777]